MAPPNISCGSSYLEISHKYKVERGENGLVTHNFFSYLPSNYKLTQSIFLMQNFPPYISPSEYKPLQK